MIKNEEQKLEYEQFNKIYIPSEYINENYKYTISGDEITIITNENCYTNYNNQYCDCIRYNERYNIKTERYECNRNPNNYILSSNQVTDNINYSTRITTEYKNNYIILYGIVIIALLFILTIKKNSRRL